MRAGQRQIPAALGCQTETEVGTSLLVAGLGTACDVQCGGVERVGTGRVAYVVGRFAETVESSCLTGPVGQDTEYLEGPPEVDDTEVDPTQLRLDPTEDLQSVGLAPSVAE